MTDTALTHRTFVALTPQEMPLAQAEITAWCRAKVIELSKELAEARQSLRDVRRLKLGRTKAWQNVITRTANRMIYYAKILAAVRAGYLVVPNFPMEVIAVRVNRRAPNTITEDTYPSAINKARPELNLPPGIGRYVDETNPHEDLSWDERVPDGKGGVTTKHHRLTKVAAYDETVDFPAALAKPIIIEATERAMALRLFDRIGIVNGGTTSLKSRKSDPIVVGQIIDGSQPRSWGGEYPHRVTFFVAWWLDTRAL